ncbi:hypothetical protein LCGC14_3116760 [marine sediment metagenome]|uniref:Uncharacterized protein n=1 Tax=marine sediment metagenome TaxID=412755 RepID=A0A0F8W3F0_9ZZZZ
MSGFSRSPAAMLAQTANSTVQAVTNSATVLAEFDTGTGTATAKALGEMSAGAAASTITVPDTGDYLVSLTAKITPPAQTHTVTVSLQKTSSDIAGALMTHVCISSVAFPIALSVIVSCAAGDVLRPAIVSSDAGPQNYTTTHAQFTAVRVA